MKHALLNSIWLFLLLSCSSKTVTKNTTSTWWINSYKVSCTGVASMSCLQIQKNETIEQGKWLNLYTEIEGFVFEPGYLQQIKVKEEKLTPPSVPADGSSIKYTLVEMLEKKGDQRFAIHDIWIVEAINDTLVPQPLESRTMLMPVIEINVTEMWVSGTDRCNSFGGVIEVLDGEKLKFGNISGTDVLCDRMEIANKFHKTLPTVRKFKKEGLKLILLNESGKEVLRLKKVD